MKDGKIIIQQTFKKTEGVLKEQKLPIKNEFLFNIFIIIELCEILDNDICNELCSLN